MSDNTGFYLDPHQLTEIAFAMAEKVTEGLNADGKELKCLPTYVPTTIVPGSGKALVLDLGGSKLRSAVVSFSKRSSRIERGPKETVMPWKRNVPFDKTKYLDIQADLLTVLEPELDLPLGYCFSYPAEPTVDRDAKLINWTKEVLVLNTEGRQVGQMLLEYLRMRDKAIRCSSVTVVNDTIASLFSGLIGPRTDVCIGLIVGTGTNMATFIDYDFIPKLSLRTVGWQGAIPVNLESGNFMPQYRTDWDRQLDEASEDPGQQLFEKMVSGAYLGRLFKAVFPESEFNPSSGAAGLSNLLCGIIPATGNQITTARAIVERSAKLIAASLAGLITMLNKSRTLKTVRIIAEGGLFWAELEGIPYYANLTKLTLESILSTIGLTHVDVDFAKIRNANLIGAALAALAK